MTRAAREPLVASGCGSIVNISSSTILFGRQNYAHYVSSKAGVMGLSRAMARELGPYGVRVNTLTPGPTFTEVERATVTPEQKEAMIATQCLRRPGGARRHRGRDHLPDLEAGALGHRTAAQCRRRNDHALKAWFETIRRQRTTGSFHMGYITNADRMLIGGKLVESTSGAWDECINPANEQPIGRVPAGTKEDVDRAVIGRRDALGPTGRARQSRIEPRSCENSEQT